MSRGKDQAHAAGIAGNAVAEEAFPLEQVAAPAADAFPMRIVVETVSIGPRDACKGEIVTVNAQMRKYLLFWGRAVDAAR